jgi:hypothetical protein
MDSVEKNLLIGAFVTGGVDTALEANWAYQAGQGKTAEPSFLYQKIADGYLPNLDDWIASAGTPLILYLLGKGLKKDSLKTMAKGGAIYGVSSLIGCTIARVAIKSQVPGYFTYRVVKASTELR